MKRRCTANRSLRARGSGHGLLEHRRRAAEARGQHELRPLRARAPSDLAEPPGAILGRSNVGLCRKRRVFRITQGKFRHPFHHFQIDEELSRRHGWIRRVHPTTQRWSPFVGGPSGAQFSAMSPRSVKCSCKFAKVRWFFLFAVPMY